MRRSPPVGRALKAGNLTIREAGFNVDRKCADEDAMTDVDAIRFLASEHDLEFVNLDSYPVDADAAQILPEAVARRHHVAAVKRKFGTPVIAIANPDDVFTLDTLRASLGRDFISVVASREQIGELLDH